MKMWVDCLQKAVPAQGICFEDIVFLESLHLGPEATESIFGLAGGKSDFRLHQTPLLLKATSYSARPIHKMAATQNFGKKGQKRKAKKGQKRKANCFLS